MPQSIFPRYSRERGLVTGARPSAAAYNDGKKKAGKVMLPEASAYNTEIPAYNMPAYNLAYNLICKMVGVANLCNFPV